jgi:hypothetical protein
MSTSRWLAWTPKRGAITEDGAETAPPKPPKLTFEGSAGATSGFFQEIGKPTTMSTPAVLSAEKGDYRGSFPHCPRCASHALYRKNNADNYECLTCELRCIDETVARRLQ